MRCKGKEALERGHIGEPRIGPRCPGFPPPPQLSIHRDRGIPLRIKEPLPRSAPIPPGARFSSQQFALAKGSGRLVLTEESLKEEPLLPSQWEAATPGAGLGTPAQGGLGPSASLRWPGTGNVVAGLERERERGSQPKALPQTRISSLLPARQGHRANKRVIGSWRLGLRGTLPPLQCSGARLEMGGGGQRFRSAGGLMGRLLFALVNRESACLVSWPTHVPGAEPRLPSQAWLSWGPRAAAPPGAL